MGRGLLVPRPFQSSVQPFGAREAPRVVRAREFRPQVVAFYLEVADVVLERRDEEIDFGRSGARFFAQAPEFFGERFALRAEGGRVGAHRKRCHRSPPGGSCGAEC